MLSLFTPSQSAASLPAPSAGEVVAPPSLEDAATISSALAGDEAAFTEVMRRQARPLFVIAFAILQNQVEAEEIVQETFVRAHQRRHGVRDPARFLVWLQAVTRNAARDVWRQRQRRADPRLFASALAPDPAPRPDDALLDREDRKKLDDAFADLPELHRTALTLRYLEGLDYRSIARAMSLSEGALRGILGRALGTLRRQLSPDLFQKTG